MAVLRPFLRWLGVGVVVVMTSFHAAADDTAGRLVLEGRANTSAIVRLHQPLSIYSPTHDQLGGATLGALRGRYHGFVVTRIDDGEEEVVAGRVRLRQIEVGLGRIGSISFQPFTATLAAGTYRFVKLTDDAAPVVLQASGSGVPNRVRTTSPEVVQFHGGTLQAELPSFSAEARSALRVGPRTLVALGATLSTQQDGAVSYRDHMCADADSACREPGVTDVEGVNATGAGGGGTSGSFWSPGELARGSHSAWHSAVLTPDRAKVAYYVLGVGQ